MKKNTIIVIAVIAISLVGALAWLQFWKKSSIEQSKIEQSNSEAHMVKKIVPETLPEIKSLSGTVKSISGDMVVFKVFPSDGKDTNDIRTIRISNIPIFKDIPFSPEDTKKMEEHLERPIADPIDLPERGSVAEDIFSDMVPAVITDMKPGDVVTVISDTDIRNVKEIRPKKMSFVFGSNVSYPDGYQP
jgi:hypothetical protein